MKDSIDQRNYSLEQWPVIVPDEQRNLRNGSSNLLHPEQLVATNRNRVRSATRNFTDASGESFVGGFPIHSPRGSALYVTSFHLPISRECQGSRCNFTLKHDSCVQPFLPRAPAVETSRDHRLSNELKLGQVRISRGNTCKRVREKRIERWEMTVGILSSKWKLNLIVKLSGYNVLRDIYTARLAGRAFQLECSLISV